MCPPLGGWESGTVLLIPSSGPWVEERDDEYPSSSSSSVAADYVVAMTTLSGFDCRLEKKCEQDDTWQLLCISFT